MDIPHGNYLLCYDIGNKYLGITLDETSAIEISEDQYQTCKRANRQFCILNALLLPLANPTTCFPSLYAKNKNGTQKRCSLQVKKANSTSIPTSIAPNIWLITSLPTAAPARITLSALERHPELSCHRHPSTYSDYNQHAVPHYSIFTCLHNMNHMM